MFIDIDLAYRFLFQRKNFFLVVNFFQWAKIKVYMKFIAILTAR